MIRLIDAAKVLADQFQGYNLTFVSDRHIILTRVTRPNPIGQTIKLMALAPLILLGGSYRVVTSQMDEICINPAELYNETTMALPRSVQLDHVKGEIRIYSAGRLIVIASREGKLVAFER